MSQTAQESADKALDNIASNMDAWEDLPGDDDFKQVCIRCHAMTGGADVGLERSPLCNVCAQDLVPTLFSALRHERSLRESAEGQAKRDAAIAEVLRKVNVELRSAPRDPRAAMLPCAQFRFWADGSDLQEANQQPSDRCFVCRFYRQHHGQIAGECEK